MSGATGCVDIVGPSGVQGWVSAGIGSGRLARVTCTDAKGGRVSFSACHHRPDVASALLEKGKHGFAVSLGLLDGLDGRVTFTDENGSVLHGGKDVALPPGPRRARDPKASLPVVIHIPKTCGTSLRETVGRSSSPAARIFVYPGEDYGLSIRELNQIPLRQRSGCSLAMGHMPFGSGAYFGRPATYATFLRQPLRRLKSNLAHIMTHGGIDASVQEHLFADVERGLIGDFDNVMVRLIAGVSTDVVPLGEISESDVDLALYNIMNHFFFVGLAEEYDDHLRKLGRMMFGREVRATSENVTSASSYGRIQNLDWDRIAHNNRFDGMLYEAVVERRLAGRDLRGRGASRARPRFGRARSPLVR